MQIDQTSFMNAVIEKTNQKLSQLQNQVILLEVQLQLALEKNKELEAEINKQKPKKTETP
jgi:ribosome-associated translation inhibitor RaiA